MKKSTLFFAIVMLFTIANVHSQSGNTINEAIDIDGTDIAVNIVDYNSITASGFTPFCDSSEDIFYRHTVSSGNNKLTIGMSSAAIALATDIDFQLLKAPNGNMSSIQVLSCDDYTVLLVVGGSFQEVIENVNPGDVYYLRVFRPSSLGGSLTPLINGTSISMSSEFDNSLSVDEITQIKPKLVVTDNSINFYNNTEFRDYQMFSMDGKRLAAATTNETISHIDISVLSNGLYVLLLQDENGKRLSYKFVKR